jgi:hypothetical protein
VWKKTVAIHILLRRWISANRSSMQCVCTELRPAWFLLTPAQAYGITLNAVLSTVQAFNFRSLVKESLGNTSETLMFAWRKCIHQIEELRFRRNENFLEKIFDGWDNQCLDAKGLRERMESRFSSLLSIHVRLSILPSFSTKNAVISLVVKTRIQ